MKIFKQSNRNDDKDKSEQEIEKKEKKVRHHWRKRITKRKQTEEKENIQNIQSVLINFSSN